MDQSLFLMQDRIFGLDLQLLADVLVTALAIFVLFFALSYLLFNPARELLKKRQQKLADEMAESRKNLDEAASYREEYDAKLKNANLEAAEILEDTRKRALRKKEEIVGEAKTEASRIVARAEQEAELEKNKVRDEVKQEMISVAAAMAGKIVASSIDPKTQEQMVKDTLEEMGEDTWLS